MSRVLVVPPGIRVLALAVRGVRGSSRQRGRVFRMVGLVIDVHAVSLTPRLSSGPILALTHCEARQR